MPNYRRVKTLGGTYFFTVVTFRRRLLFERAEARTILGDVIREVCVVHPFAIDGWVLLPDHLHCMWTLPPEDFDFSLRWKLIKSTFSKRTKHLFHADAWLTDSRRKHRESTIWQRRFWEHRVRNEDEYRIYMDYIHFNPVKHGWVQRVADWPFSTFHQYVQSGVYNRDWGGIRADTSLKTFGE